MAMSKKELAEVDALRARHREATSLRDLTIHAPTPVPVDRDYGAGLVTGLWWTNTYRLWDAHGGSVSNSVGEGRRRGSFSHSRDASGSSWSQGSGVFYASRRDALTAVRDAVVARLASTLAALDAEIEKEP